MSDIESALSSLLKTAKETHREPEPDTGAASRAAQLVSEAGLPLRHARTKPSQLKGFTEALRGVEERLGSSFLLILCGARGRGKTQLACEAIKATCRMGRSARYTTLFRVISCLKATFEDRYRSEADVIDEMVKPRLLVIDEVGKTTQSDYTQSTLFEILDRRYAALKDTIIISNHSEAELNDQIGASILRRADETGGVIDVSGWAKPY